MHENTYYYWQKRLREAACEQLMTAQTNSTHKELARPEFTEVRFLDSVPQIINTEAIFQGNLSIEVSGMKITTDSTYPVDQLSYLLRELVKQC